MDNRKFVYIVTCICFLLGIVGACTQPALKQGQQKAVSSTKASSETTRMDDVVATLDGNPITYKQLNDRIQTLLFNFEEKIYAMKQDALEEMIEDQILAEEAKSRNTTVAELVKQEVEDKIVVDKTELDEFYNRFQSRLQGTETEKRKRLEDILKRRKENEVRTRFLTEIKKKHQIEISLQPPEPPVVDVSIDDDPVLGPDSAKVTLIEFSDFQCPFCKRAASMLKQLRDEYKDKIRLVFRDFPLSFHPEAEISAMAAGCAHDQGKFWEYHDLLFENSQDLKRESLVEYAKSLKLDVDKFNACLDAEKYKEEIDKDKRDGEKAGVRGTPAVFVNGRMVSGAKPIEYFKQLIDKELGRN